MSVTTIIRSPAAEAASESPAARRARALNEKFGDASATDILKAALTEEFAGDIALVSSFGTEAAVLLALAAEVDPDVPVVFLETGKHFGQTLSYQRQLTERLGLTNVQLIRPDVVEEAAEDAAGTLWRTNADACCDLRKVRPLDRALEGYGAWVTGRKQYQGGVRESLPFFEADGDQIKVNPLARWTPEEITAFFEDRDLPRHPLQDQGYPSIGCWPCTKPADAANPRAGRWAGQDKTECGIHTASAKRRAAA